MTLTKFIKESGIDASLVRAVVRNLGGWETAQESMIDITNHGIDGGFGGFIYYADTVAFFRKNRKAILAMAENMAQDLGEDMIAMISNFNCLSEDGKPEYTQTEIAMALFSGKGDGSVMVANAMAWFAGEEVSRRYSDIME